MHTTEKKTFTGRSGRHSTRWSVRMADRISSVVITVGGVGTIVAVTFVFVVLVWVVFPLFQRASLESFQSATIPFNDRQPLHIRVDEYNALVCAIYSDGQVEAYRTDNGEKVWSKDLVAGDTKVMSGSFHETSNEFALSLDDGTLRLGTIGFKTSFLNPEDVDEDVKKAADTELALATVENGVVQLTPQGQFRKQTVAIELGEPLKFVGKPLTSLQHTARTRGFAVTGLTQDGELHWATIRSQKNILTQKTTYKVSAKQLELPDDISTPPDYIVLLGTGDSVCAVWENGTLVRYDTRSASDIQLAERLELVESGTKVTCVKLLIQRETLLVGDSTGQVTGWFRVRNASAQNSDGHWLLPVHRLPKGKGEVAGIGVSQRSRMFAVGYGEGAIDIFHSTTDEKLIRAEIPMGEQLTHIGMSPKDNGVFAFSSKGFWLASFDPAYPETNFRSLFSPIWYEGRETPDLTWQSSFAGVGSEMKLGLRPLIFGTIKATLYSMLFGAPIAILAAIYTSEFLSPRWRNSIKSLIEMMASLPSVVLGFLGGLVIAPFVENIVPETLCAFVLVPFAFVLGAFIWQQLPRRVAIRLSRFRLWFVLIAMVFGTLMAKFAGPIVNRIFFADDIVLWLDRQKGTGTGAWMFLLIPLSAFLMTLFVSFVVNPWLVRISSSWSVRVFTLVNLCKFLIAAVASLALAAGVSYLLSIGGLDPRGTYVDTYMQRNAMVVGFVMGFAIIPIIYTIAEDAISTVPNHLRSASLGAGATPWQTAIRVVLPTAMSGLFSALMIGLGRAVGETMIVLMAAGNTPVREWNIFNGFRTLSANIAVELPEAVVNSTHYRTLFLAALTLLVLTFFVNTIAELVRLRFRKRAVQL